MGGLSLPFDNQTTTLVKRFVSSAVSKIYKFRTEKLRELEAPLVAKLTQQLFVKFNALAIPCILLLLQILLCCM